MGAFKYLGDSKITKLYGVIFGKKYILGFDISVQNFQSVAVIHGQT